MIQSRGVKEKLGFASRRMKKIDNQYPSADHGERAKARSWSIILKQRIREGFQRHRKTWVSRGSHGGKSKGEKKILGKRVKETWI